MSSPSNAKDPPAVAYRSYKLESGSFRDKQYHEGFLLVDDARKLLEVRQLSGKKKKEETIVARFRVEPHADVSAKGAVLKVSELSLTLESAQIAGGLAERLKRPGIERKEAKLLSQAESTVKACLEAREEAISFLSRMRLDPRGALLGGISMWPPGDTRTPLEAIYSGYSSRVAASIEETKSFLAGAQVTLGARTVERLFALVYTIGVVQDALFEGHSDMAAELAALQELGISATAQELRMEKPSERLILRGHSLLLESLPATALPKSFPLS